MGRDGVAGRGRDCGDPGDGLPDARWVSCADVVRGSHARIGTEKAHGNARNLLALCVSPLVAWVVSRQQGEGTCLQMSAAWGLAMTQ